MRNFDTKNIRYMFIYLQSYQFLYRLLSVHIFLRLQPIREQFYGILYSYATHVVLLNFTIYITVLCLMFLLCFVNIFGIPNMCTAT